MVKYTQTIRRLLPTNCFIVLDHFVGMPLKELMQDKIEELDSRCSCKHFPVQSQ